MPTAAPDHGLKLFTTCPPSALAQPGTCLRQSEEIARWSEDAGCEGIQQFDLRIKIDAIERDDLRTLARIAGLLAAHRAAADSSVARPSFRGAERPDSTDNVR